MECTKTANTVKHIYSTLSIQCVGKQTNKKKHIV